MKKNNKDKLTFVAAFALIILFLGLVVFSIVKNFDIFSGSNNNNEEETLEEGILPLVQAQDVSQENQNKEISFVEGKIKFSDKYIVIRKANTEQDSFFMCALSETDCLFYEIQNKESGIKYYLSETTPVLVENTELYSQEENGQIKIQDEDIDVVREYVTIIPDDPDSDGPNLDLAEKSMQQIYGCIPDSSICFSSGLLTVENNEQQVEEFLKFLNDLEYE